MALIDLDSLSPKLRAGYIATGRRFGSDRTLAQGVETLKATNEHLAAVTSQGFGPAKARRLAAAIEQLRLLGGDREQSRLAAGLGTDARHAAQAAGKAARTKASNVLSLSVEELLLLGDEEAAVTIERVLQQARASGSDLSLLDRQLEGLGGALDMSRVREVTKDAGGEEARAAVRAAREGLVPVLERGKTHAGNTPVETERLDILDGIIVGLCRQARAASRTAARELGHPAMAKAFELDVLYGRS